MKTDIKRKTQGGKHGVIKRVYLGGKFSLRHERK